MENKNMENKVKSAFEHATPDIYDTIANDIKDSKGQVILMTKKNNGWLKRGLAIAAALAIIVTGVFVANNQKKIGDEVISVVSLDVNPSLQIKLKKDNVVKEVVALNEDGIKIVDNMDFGGSKLEVALNALVGAMVKNGFLSDLANSILVSVEGQDKAQNEALQKQISTEIEKILGGSKVESAVLSQTVSENEELKKLADTYGISMGKAQLITEIAKKNTRYKVEDLAGLTINELNLLSEGKGQHVDHVTASGTASSKAYIGNEKAKAIALGKAGVAETDVREFEVDLDMEAGKMVYEVDFDTVSYEFEYDIDAKTGDILKEQKEPRDRDDIDDHHDDDYHHTGSGNGMSTQTPTTQNPTTQTPETGEIGREKAKNIALSHAGVSASNAREMEVELDTEKGVKVYEVSFESAGIEYDYEIDASTGKIIKAEKERD